MPAWKTEPCIACIAWPSAGQRVPESRSSHRPGKAGVRRSPTQGAGPRMNRPPSSSATPLRGQCPRGALRGNDVPMKTGHEMCPLTNDHGSGISGHGSRWNRARWVPSAGTLDVCASRSGLRPRRLAHTSSRDHRSSPREKNEEKLDTSRNTRIRKECPPACGLHCHTVLHAVDEVANLHDMLCVNKVHVLLIGVVKRVEGVVTR